MTEETTPREKLAAAIAALGLTIEATFVPFSQSRNKHEKSPSLNWRITLKRGDKPLLMTDYTAGCAHAPSYRQTFGRRTAADHERAQRVAWECENGRPAAAGTVRRDAIKPDPVAVVWSLIYDADVIEYAGFEEWAHACGYDTDSRKAEATYRACLDIAVKLRAGIGEDGLAALRTAGEGY